MSGSTYFRPLMIVPPLALPLTTLNLKAALRRTFPNLKRTKTHFAHALYPRVVLTLVLAPSTRNCVRGAGALGDHYEF
jgi:hypothetical protein